MSHNLETRLTYSVDELARLIGCGRDTIYRAIHEGRLNAKKLGRLTRIPADEAHRFIESLPDLDFTTEDRVGVKR